MAGAIKAERPATKEVSILVYWRLLAYVFSASRSVWLLVSLKVVQRIHETKDVVSGRLRCAKRDGFSGPFSEQAPVTTENIRARQLLPPA